MPHRATRWIGSLALLLMLPHPFAAAADAAAVLTQARQLLAAGAVDAAITALDAQLVNHAADPAFNLLLAQALERAGRSDAALFAYERVAMADPQQVEARLRMAEIYAERGNRLLGREVTTALVPTTLTPAQQQRLAAVRTRLDQTHAGLSLSGYVLTGIGWDSNLTAGPVQKQLFIPAYWDALGTLAETGSARAAADGVMQWEAGLNLSQPLGDNSVLVGSTTLRHSLYPSHHDDNEGVANLNLGVMTRRGRQVWGLAALAQGYSLGDTLYRQALGGYASWTSVINDQTQLTGYLQYVDFTYPDHPIDDSVRRVVGATAEYTPINQPWRLQYGFYGGVDKVKDSAKPHFTFNLHGGLISGTLDVNDRLSLATSLTVERRRYDDFDHQFSDPGRNEYIQRRDWIYTFGLSADYRLTDQWHLLPLYVYTRNPSNLELYEYDRHLVMLQVKWEFSR
ncbi:DUF560 domain-containing protein [Rhodoferax sp. 4810]|uniref:DUF560 domain-containing protein n=1 Tax=Thiospirillum jenense TaxID=1653858 RepID=A0A839HEP7_9GAMM|nr:surface lipoprotein assembly modifier [Thiospirillum jenense]MBB1072956.1 DUF560 domain-containing protein [Rhodoferax jenense]MBB1124902.1 DUF560 domain-containing protein [Thiospirillum jenense]